MGIMACVSDGCLSDLCQWGGVEQLAANLLAGRAHQLRRPPQQAVEFCEMSRLIIVSNRVQQPVAEGAGNQGGLAVALSAALREHSGLWFGWSGDTTAHFTGEIDCQNTYGVTTPTLHLEEQDQDKYYHGYTHRP